jgi:hypothetical protein
MPCGVIVLISRFALGGRAGWAYNPPVNQSHPTMSLERNREAEKALLREGGKLSKEDKAAQSAEMKRRNTAAKVARSGQNTRIKGHVTVATQRKQGKRDSR